MIGKPRKVTRKMGLVINIKILNNSRKDSSKKNRLHLPPLHGSITIILMTAILLRKKLIHHICTQ